MAHTRYHFTTATWRAIADHLRMEGNSVMRRGRTRESQELYRLSREIEVNIRHGSEHLMVRPDDLRRIDRAFSRLSSVVEEPSNDTDAITQADTIIRENQRGRLRRA